MARQELKAEFDAAMGGIVVLATGIALLLVAFVSLIVALILFLSQYIAGWLAAVLLAIFFIAVGTAIIFAGKRMLEIKPLEKTRETLMEDFKWVQHQKKQREK